MKASAFFAIVTLAAGAALGTSGCNAFIHSPPARHGPPTYALAVTVKGGQAPTAEQWAKLQSTFGQMLAARGLVLVSNVGLADQIIRVEFVPDIDDPVFGTVLVLGVMPNALSYIATNRAPTVNAASYGSSSTFGLVSDPSYYNSIYGYTYPSSNDYYPDNSPGGTITPVSPPDVKGHHDRPTPVDPADCPPGTTVRPTPPQNVVADHPHPTPPPHDNRTWRSEPTYSRSEPTYSPPPSSSSSSSSYSDSSSSFSSGSSSFSAPSYSAPAESSSSSGSSSSSRTVER